MIQRIQSVYLLIAACAMALCFLFPTATFCALSGQQPVSGELNLIAKAAPDMLNQIAEGQPVVMSQEGFVNTWPLVAVALGVIAISLVSLFLYKHRVRQMRLAACGFLLAVIYVFLLFIWAVDAYVDGATTAMNCTDIHLRYGVGTWSPAAAALLLFLAQRAIKKDEAKVRAADRLR